MARFLEVTPTFSVSPQMTLEDVEAAKTAGFTLIVNNRPDGEAPGQPTGAEIEAGARAAGLDYASIPIIGRPTPDQAQAQVRAVTGARGKALAYCRSGNRSITAWALGELAAETRSRGELLRLARVAGYDLDPMLPR